MEYIKCKTCGHEYLQFVQEFNKGDVVELLRRSQNPRGIVSSICNDQRFLNVRFRSLEEKWYSKTVSADSLKTTGRVDRIPKIGSRDSWPPIKEKEVV